MDGTLRGENIGWGFGGSNQSMLDWWKGSSAHNANLLDSRWTAVGIKRVYVQGSYWGWYWAVDFGSALDARAATCGATSAAPTPSPSPTPSSGTALTIVGSGRTSNSNNSAYAYDLKLSTNWVAASKRPPTYAYVWFDLGSTKAIGGVQWVFAQTGYADSFTIQVSNDRATWTTLATKGNAAAGSWQTLTTSASARYVRFSFANPNKDKQLGSLAEVKITA
jgi:hypothetical protein